jgi:uncharacterized protein (DUF58 family)
MLSTEVLARIKALTLRSRYLANDLMAGEYASAFHGRGMEFHEVREYVPGDDVRGIDWNVTARIGQPFVKVFREERELTIMLMVDVSASMAVGEVRSRRAAAAELASVIAWLAIRSNDRVGLLLFGDKIEVFLPPKKGQPHIWKIIKELLTWPANSRGTMVDAAAEHLLKVIKRRCVCFLISDFLSTENHDSLKNLARQHDLTCVLMGHRPLEGLASFGGAGVISYQDPESGETAIINTSDRHVLSAVEENSKVWRSNFELAVRGWGADFFKVEPGEGVVDPLIDYLRRHHSISRRRVLP